MQNIKTDKTCDKPKSGGVQRNRWNSSNRLQCSVHSTVLSCCGKTFFNSLFLVKWFTRWTCMTSNPTNRTANRKTERSANTSPLSAARNGEIKVHIARWPRWSGWRVPSGFSCHLCCTSLFCNRGDENCRKNKIAATPHPRTTSRIRSRHRPFLWAMPFSICSYSLFDLCEPQGILSICQVLQFVDK